MQTEKEKRTKFGRRNSIKVVATEGYVEEWKGKVVKELLTGSQNQRGNLMKCTATSSVKIKCHTRIINDYTLFY